MAGNVRRVTRAEVEQVLARVEERVGVEEANLLRAVLRAAWALDEALDGLDRALGGEPEAGVMEVEV
jgi:hypothetical protein